MNYWKLNAWKKLSQGLQEQASELRWKTRQPCFICTVNLCSVIFPVIQAPYLGL